MFMAPILAGITPGLVTGLSIASTALGAVSEAKQANYQSGLLQQQALRDSYQGQVSAQDAGLNAAQEKAQLVLQQVASGFSISSSGFTQRRAALSALANRDQMRITEDGQAKAAVSLANAATAKAEAHNAILSGIFGIGKDLISGANLVAKQNNFNTNEGTRDVVAAGVP